MVEKNNTDNQNQPLDDRIAVGILGVEVNFNDTGFLLRTEPPGSVVRTFAYICSALAHVPVLNLFCDVDPNDVLPAYECALSVRRTEVLSSLDCSQRLRDYIEKYIPETRKAL